MQDWIGLLFFVVLAAGVIIGLKLLAKPRPRTAEEFERNAADGSSLGAFANALQEALDPAAAKAKEVQVQMKDGTFRKKKREGKSNDIEFNESNR